MSFGIAPNFEEPDCLAATGVLSLSFSEDLKGVEGTFKGWGGILGHETRTDKVEMISTNHEFFPRFVVSYLLALSQHASLQLAKANRPEGSYAFPVTLPTTQTRYHKLLNRDALFVAYIR